VTAVLTEESSEVKMQIALALLLRSGDFYCIVLVEAGVKKFCNEVECVERIRTFAFECCCCKRLQSWDLQKPKQGSASGVCYGLGIA